MDIRYYFVVAAIFIFAVIGLSFYWFKFKAHSATSARGAEIHSINSVTDVDLLQRKAVLDVSEDYASGATATLLCHLDLSTLLVTIIGSIGGLLLIRCLKRRLSPDEDDT